MSASSGVSFDLTVSPLPEPKGEITHIIAISSIRIGSLFLSNIYGLEGKYNQTGEWFLFSDSSQNSLIDSIDAMFPPEVGVEIFNIIRSIVIANIKIERALQ